MDGLQSTTFPDPGLPGLLLNHANRKARKMQEGFDMRVIPDGDQRYPTFGERFHFMAILSQFG